MAKGRTNGVGMSGPLDTWVRLMISLVFCVGVVSCADTYSSSQVIRRRAPSEAQSADIGKSSQPAPVSASSASDYHIRTLDSLQINVFNEPDLSVKVRVNSQGMINYPMLGAVQVGGLTVSEAENLLKERLGRDYLVNPQVSVLVDRANSRRVFILGQVRSPGAYEFTADESLTLLQAISRAGGFTPVAAPGRVSIIRSEDGVEKKITVNVTAVINSGDRSKDIELQSDDVVVVPESIF
jgi:polysaccharide biosynthesis/export protein